MSNSSKLPADALDPRSRLIMLYAMCGFANFGSLGIMIGGLGTMAPERREEIDVARPEIDRVGHADDLPDGRDRGGDDVTPLPSFRGDAQRRARSLDCATAMRNGSRVSVLRTAPE